MAERTAGRMSRSTAREAAGAGTRAGTGAGTGIGTRDGGRSYLLTLGFGTTVAMWAVGYLTHMPPVWTPSWLVLLLLVACLFAGGWLAGRYTGRGWAAGAQTGLVAWALNLLILGSLLSGSEANRVVPSALWWIPGSLVVAAGLGAAGAALGAARPASKRDTGERDAGERRAGERKGGERGLRERGTVSGGNAIGATSVNWTAGFSRVAVAATFLLLLAGGLVTSHQAGLAVVDWPNSFGYNMFLYPLSRMTGGIYYEHAHRLFGALVGLTTVVLALHLLRADRRRWVHGFALAAVVLVVLQGILGGLRVTGHFTMSASPEVTRPNLALAVVHGVTGQLFFAAMVALSAFTASTWKSSRPATETPAAGTDRGLAAVLVALLFVQLTLGALLRHTGTGLMIHIGMATIVTILAVSAGVRAAGLDRGQPLLQRVGRWVLALLGAQVVLGIGALIATGYSRGAPAPPTYDVLLTTAHQATGALLLAAAVLLLVWARRLLRPSA